MNKMFAAVIVVTAACFRVADRANSDADDNSSLQAVQGSFSFIKSQKGVTMVEYALIAALITLFVLLLLTQAGQQVQAFFQRMIDALAGAAGGS